jgi:hypothetical protein
VSNTSTLVVRQDGDRVAVEADVAVAGRGEQKNARRELRARRRRAVLGGERNRTEQDKKKRASNRHIKPLTTDARSELRLTTEV